MMMMMMMMILMQAAPCGLRGCKNWPALFPGRMSYKATKPGLVSVLYLSMRYTVLFLLLCVLFVVVKLSVLTKWLARKTPLRKPNRGEGIVSRKPRPKSAHDSVDLLYCFIVLLCISVVSCPYVIYYPTVMARYSLFMLKVPLNPKQTNKLHISHRPRKTSAICHLKQNHFWFNLANSSWLIPRDDWQMTISHCAKTCETLFLEISEVPELTVSCCFCESYVLVHGQYCVMCAYVEPVRILPFSAPTRWTTMSCIQSVCSFVLYSLVNVIAENVVNES